MGEICICLEGVEFYNFVFDVIFVKLIVGIMIEYGIVVLGELE